MLLKNDNNLLPLKGCRKVAVVGPLADSKANMADRGNMMSRLNLIMDW